MLANISSFLSSNWQTITLILMIVAGASTGISYYAHAETKRLIAEEIATPMAKINNDLKDIKDTQNDFSKEMNKQQIGVERNKEKLNGIEQRLDLIIRLLDKDQPSPGPNR